MPLYEFRCAAGHVEERIAPPRTTTAACSCGEQGTRLNVFRISRAVIPGRRINLAEALEADAEVKHAYARAGVEPPDIAGVARRAVSGMQEGQ
ncbi:MAG: hypothetical protein CVU47_06375 [Chloroflexi bacterium HGW-Chloroflexi-9]|nr:MAG: hypothetical protein CVU47_06375 [Chloroflexi bacterium HGW-Chloroflexi-9]